MSFAVRSWMRDGRRSAMAEVLPWWREDQMEEEDKKKKGKGKEKEVVEEETVRRCWRHSLRSPSGVCSACLRDRLLRLCPDCHSLRPCGCSPSSSSSSSSSSSAGSGRWIAGGESGFGHVGPVSLLIESEPAFRRSRSMGFPLLRSQPVADPATGDHPTPPSRRQSRGRVWASIWPFSRSAGARTKEPPPASGLFRSRTVAVGRSSTREGVREEDRKKEWWMWRFPSPVVLLRQRKKAAPESLVLRRW